jgi:hypothetical protein
MLPRRRPLRSSLARLSGPAPLRPGRIRSPRRKAGGVDREEGPLAMLAARREPQGVLLTRRC